LYDIKERERHYLYDINERERHYLYDIKERASLLVRYKGESVTTCTI